MRKSIFIGSIVSVTIIALSLGYWIGQTPIEGNLDEVAIVQRTKDEIKNRLIEAKIINPEPEQAFALRGTVKKVGENYIVIIPSIKQDPFGDIFPPIVKVLIDENTQIHERILKNPEEYMKEIEEYQQNPEGSVHPKLYIENISKIEEIKPGYYIHEIYSGKNLKGIKEFTAVEISFSLERFY